MDGLNTINKYYIKELNKVNEKLYNLFNNKEKKKIFKKEEDKLYNNLNNPKKKNLYSLYVFIYFLKSLYMSSSKDEIFDLTEEKAELLLKKKIIDDLLDSNSNNIFMAFDFINEVMIKLNFTIKEKLDVYNYIITKNIKNKISRNKVYKLDVNKLPDNEYKEHIKLLFYLPNKEKYLKNKSLTKNYNNMIKEMNNSKVDAENEVIAHDVFKIAFNKEHKEDYDIKNIIDSIRIFNFSENDIQKVKKHYEKEKVSLNKEKVSLNKEKVLLKIDFKSYKKREEERNLLRKEKDKYLNNKDNLINFLNYKELKELVMILKKLDYDKEYIREIINENELELQKYSLNEKYDYYIELMKVYAEKCGFLKELEELIEKHEKGIILEDNMALMLKYIPNMSEYLLK